MALVNHVEDIAGKRILVTGATGLLGSKLCESLSSAGCTVYAMVRTLPEKGVDAVEYIMLDLADEFNDTRLPRDLDVVIHLAQSSQFREFPHAALDMFHVNVQSTAKLLDFARGQGVEKFIVASSGGVYGNGNDPFNENSPIIPLGSLGYYIGSKMCSEILAHSYVGLFQVTTLRFFFMYGPGQQREMLIPRLFDNVAAGRAITLQGESGIRINPIHVDDAVQAVIASISTEHSATYNIAGPDILSIREITEAMGHYLDCHPNYQMNSDTPKDLVGDNAAMVKSLHTPTRHLLESLSDIAMDHG